MKAIRSPHLEIAIILVSMKYGWFLENLFAAVHLGKSFYLSSIFALGCILTLALNSTGQVFEETITVKVLPRLSTSFSFSQTSNSSWTSTYLDAHSEEVQLLRLFENSTSLSYEIVSISPALWKCASANLAQHTTKNDQEFGVGIYFSNDSSSTVLAAFQFKSDSLEIKTLDSVKANSSLISLNSTKDEAGILKINAIIQHHNPTYDSTYINVYQLKNSDSVEVESATIIPMHGFHSITDACLFNDSVLIMASEFGVILSASLIDLSVDTIWNGEEQCFDTLKCAITFYNLLKLSKQHFAISGHVRIDRDPSPTTFNFDYDQCIFKVSLEGEVEIEFYQGVKDTLFTGIYKHLDEQAGMRSLISNNSGVIYIVSTSNLHLGSNGFFSNDSTSLLIARVDSNLNLQWRRQFWGDTSRLINYGCQPTADGGLIIYSLKYDYRRNQEKSLNLHILRLHADGRNHTLELIERIDVGYFVYPNPTYDKISVNRLDHDHTEVWIRSLTGNLHQFLGTYTTKNFDLNLSDFSAGIYILTFKSNENHHSERILKL